MDACILGQVYANPHVPTSTNSWFSLHPVSIGGPDPVEGGIPTLTADSTRSFVAFCLKAPVPKAGDYVVCTQVDGISSFIGFYPFGDHAGLWVIDSVPTCTTRLFGRFLAASSIPYPGLSLTVLKDGVFFTSATTDVNGSWFSSPGLTLANQVGITYTVQANPANYAPVALDFPIVPCSTMGQTLILPPDSDHLGGVGRYYRGVPKSLTLHLPNGNVSLTYDAASSGPPEYAYWYGCQTFTAAYETTGGARDGTTRTAGVFWILEGRNTGALNSISGQYWGLSSYVPSLVRGSVFGVSAASSCGSISVAAVNAGGTIGTDTYLFFGNPSTSPFALASTTPNNAYWSFVLPGVSVSTHPPITVSTP